MTMVSVDRENGWFEKNHKPFRMTMIWAQTRPNSLKEEGFWKKGCALLPPRTGLSLEID